MKLRKVYTVVCALLVTAVMAISTPASAQGLIGDTITSCFDNILDCPNDQHWDNDTAVVVDPGVEFTGIGNPNAGDVLTADFSGPTGSRLTITDCCTPNGSGVGAGVYRFLFSDLDFGHPITNVTIDEANSQLPVLALSFTANSIDITLDRFLLFGSPKSLVLDIVALDVGLIGDTITSCFDNILDCPNDQHWDNDTAVVVDPGVEFTGIGNPNAGDVLTADFSGPTGSRLTITDCCTPNGSGVAAGAYRFVFSDLDFGNPITDVTIDLENSLLPVQALNFTANTIEITRMAQHGMRGFREPEGCPPIPSLKGLGLKYR